MNEVTISRSEYDGLVMKAGQIEVLRNFYWSHVEKKDNYMDIETVNRVFGYDTDMKEVSLI